MLGVNPTISPHFTGVASFGKAVKEYDDINKSSLASIASKLAGKSAYPTSEFGFGTYNLLVRIAFEDGSSSWMCRIPRQNSLFDTPNAEMESEFLHSTISTMKYVAAHTSIPVPKIYGYCLTSDNEARTPYLFLEDFRETVSLSEVISSDEWD